MHPAHRSRSGYRFHAKRYCSDARVLSAASRILIRHRGRLGALAAIDHGMERLQARAAVEAERYRPARLPQLRVRFWAAVAELIAMGAA